MPEDKSLLDPGERVDLRAVIVALREAGAKGAAILNRVGARTQADRLFLYPRDKDSDKISYRRSAPTNNFALRFLNVLTENAATIREVLGEFYFKEIDSLIACRRDSRWTAIGEIADEGPIETPFDALPEKYRNRINQFSAKLVDDMEVIFSGYKIVFRVAFEDTGRIAREVIRFSRKGGMMTYSWWFQTAGRVGPLNRRKNQGVVLPLNTCYLLTGFHDSGRSDELRFRSAVLQRETLAYYPNLGAQIGISTSTNAQLFYPTATKFLWVTIRDADITQEQEFLDRTVGFFGREDWDGLKSLEESFKGAVISNDAISIIWNYIKNSTDGTKLLSAPREREWTARQAPLLLRQDWKAIIASYKDAAKE
jgi:hypothetical protein